MPRSHPRWPGLRGPTPLHLHSPCASSVLPCHCAVCLVTGVPSFSSLALARSRPRYLCMRSMPEAAAAPSVPPYAVVPSTSSSCHALWDVMPARVPCRSCQCPMPSWSQRRHRAPRAPSPWPTPRPPPHLSASTTRPGWMPPVMVSPLLLPCPVCRRLRHRQVAPRARCSSAPALPVVVHAGRLLLMPPWGSAPLHRPSRGHA